MKDDRPERTRPEPVDRDSPKRPTPVRELMDAVPGDEKETSSTADEARPQATRTVTVDGEDWTARAEGSGRSGRGMDSGAPLLLVTFARGVPADGDDDVASPEREALAVGSSLDDLSHDALTELFLRSRPFRPRDH